MLIYSNSRLCCCKIFRKKELFSEKIFIEMFIRNLKSFLKCIMIMYFYKQLVLRV